jgi:hypothetical protein
VVVEDSELGAMLDVPYSLLAAVLDPYVEVGGGGGGFGGYP